MNTNFLIQAHRGGGIDWPENTLESCRHAWSLHACVVPELDISTTADGVIVAFHDKDLSRIVIDMDPALVGRTISQLNWEQVSRLDVGRSTHAKYAGQRIARVDDAFAELASHRSRQLYLDYKSAPLPELARLVDLHGVSGQVIFATKEHAKIIEWKKLVPSSQTLLWIGNAGQAEFENRLSTHRGTGFAGITQLQLHTEVTPGGQFVPSAGFIGALATELLGRDIRLQAFPYTGKFAGRCDARAFGQLIELGVRSFATDYVDDALRAVISASH
jgi:glycerophosphoryl diester phosphodiesterase